MAKPTNQTELQALKDLISECHLILDTSPLLPENHSAACLELLSAALALVDNLIKNGTKSSAAVKGRKGGSTTARKLGAEH